MLLFWVLGIAKADSSAGKSTEGGLNHLLGMDEKKFSRESAESLLSSKSVSKSGEDGSKSPLSYNVFSIPSEEGRDGEKRKTKRSSGKRQKGLGKKKKGKGKSPDEEMVSPIPSGLDQESMMMAAQSTYQPPVSSLLLKNTDDKDKKKDFAELKKNMDEMHDRMNKAMKGMEEALSHMSEAVNIVTKSKKIAGAVANTEGTKKREAPKSQNLLNYNVIEVEDERK